MTINRRIEKPIRRDDAGSRLLQSIGTINIVQKPYTLLKCIKTKYDDFPCPKAEHANDVTGFSFGNVELKEPPGT